MKKIHETGNAKNVANFEDLISFCEAYQTAYKPSNESIQLTKLKTLLEEARAKMAAVHSAATDYSNAINERALLFKPLKKFSTRIVNALGATGATNLVVADARTMVRKIQGIRAHKRKQAATPLLQEEGILQAAAPIKSISTAQTSYDNVTEHFARLVTTLKAESLYTPNEVELKPTALATLLTTMNSVNTAVINKATALSNARVARNKMLYDRDTGIHRLIQEIKKYLKSVFGANSPEFRQVSRISFKLLHI